MKGEDQAAAATIQPPGGAVMGHHHHHHNQHHHNQQQPQQIIHKSPVALAPMDPEVPLVDNINPDSPVIALVGAGHVPLQQFKELEDECLSLRESNLKMKQQLVDSQRRERLMLRRLAAKEQELLDYVNQVAELKSVQTPAQTALKTAMLDPAVNVLFQKLKQELTATQARLEETQNELAAWKFTPDSNTGKRLMAKCRLLHQENEELGKLTSNGRLAKLESELAMQKGVSEDLKKSHCDLDEVLLELEEDVEGMQNTILLMQRELKVEKERNQSVERENGRMLTVLRDKPEWLAVVQAKQAEAAAAQAAAAMERLKVEQLQHDAVSADRLRLNGVSGGGGGGMEVDDDDVMATSSAATSTQQQQQINDVVRTQSGEEEEVLHGRTTAAAEGGDSIIVHATNGKESLVNSSTSGCNSSGNTNNGQSMVATRKRTRSSVATTNCSVVVVVPSDQELEAAGGAGEVEDTNCVGKRNRFANSSNSDQQNKSAPRTRGQLLQVESEKAAAKLESDLVKEEGNEDDDEEVVMDDAPASGVENGQASAEKVVVFGNSNNNNNNGKEVAAEENGAVAAAGLRRPISPEVGAAAALKLKLENGSGGAGATAAGIDLRQENTSV